MSYNIKSAALQDIYNDLTEGSFLKDGLLPGERIRLGQKALACLAEREFPKRKDLREDFISLAACYLAYSYLRGAETVKLEDMYTLLAVAQGKWIFNPCLIFSGKVPGTGVLLPTEDPVYREHAEDLEALIVDMSEWFMGEKCKPVLDVMCNSLLRNTTAFSVFGLLDYVMCLNGGIYRNMDYNQMAGRILEAKDVRPPEDYNTRKEFSAGYGRDILQGASFTGIGLEAHSRRYNRS